MTDNLSDRMRAWLNAHGGAPGSQPDYYQDFIKRTEVESWIALHEAEVALARSAGYDQGWANGYDESRTDDLEDAQVRVAALEKVAEKMRPLVGAAEEMDLQIHVEGGLQARGLDGDLR